MRRLRLILGLDAPQEARFFLGLAGFALAITVVYWFLTYEAAGSVLLLGFGLATGVAGVRLALDPRAARVRRRVRAEGGVPDLRADRLDVAGGGTGGVDRPFLDESGRLPSETLAPFAVGLGAAAAVTAIIFGPAPLIAGALPLGWGMWTWLTSAIEEFRAGPVAGTGTPSAPARAGVAGGRDGTATGGGVPTLPP